jgi:hypothetical protein
MDSCWMLRSGWPGGSRCVALSLVLGVMGDDDRLVVDAWYLIVRTGGRAEGEN